MSSNIFYYEPFYDLERLLGDTLSSRLGFGGHELQRREKGEAAPAKELRPR